MSQFFKSLGEGWLRHCQAALAMALGFLSPLHAAVQAPSLDDVQPVVEEMLNYHVEYKEFGAPLMQRTFKLFIDHFDPFKVYLTAAEIEPYLSLSDKKATQAAQSYQFNRYPDFVALNALIAKAIERNIEWREELQRGQIVTAKAPEAVVGESYLEYASNEIQLKERLQKQLLLLLWEEHKKGIKDKWDPETREKIGAYWNKRYVRHERNYAKDNGSLLAQHILKAAARSLDAHSAFYTAEEALEMRASLEKQFEGIGVVLKEGVDGIVIADLLPGGPAERSGLISIGDIMMEINGYSLADASYDEALKMLQNRDLPYIEVGVKRQKTESPGDEFLRVKLKREKILLEQERVRYTSEPVEGGIIGKIILSSFYESEDGSSCERDLREAIRSLKREGPLKGLVLDIRENSGGFLNQAIRVAGLFMTSGVVVISKYSQGQVRYLRNIDGRIYYDGPLVILTSQASASAAEIVAQALQDYGTALVVGDERTYGKGTIQYQTVTDARAQAYFKVTIGRYYTVSGRSTQMDGVKADLVVPTPFAAFRIGERYLEYSLRSDRMPSAYHDPLSDLDIQTKAWFQKNYLPNLQLKQSRWQEMLPELRKKSAARMAANPVCRQFMKELHEIQAVGSPSYANRNWWHGEDWQITEAIEILKDMISSQ